MGNGICTLANDAVYDQVLALINSVEMNAGEAMPVCIYPYDDRLDKLRQLAAERPQVQLFEDQTVIQRWDAWVEEIWDYHPTAATKWLAVNGKPGIHRMGTHRRFCAFDGPFDRFIYMDADTLLLRNPEPIFEALETVDWVTYDFQYKDLSHVFAVDSPQMTILFTQDALKNKTFCSGFYGSKRGLIGAAEIEFYLEKLSQGEAEVLYPMAPDQTILNYFVLRQPIASVNLALTLKPEERTGNSVTSLHFEEQNGQVFDKGVPLLYLHYIGLSSKFFARLCQGENLAIPYRDTFLHYRFHNLAATLPAFKGKPMPLTPVRKGIPARILQKAKSLF